jgi:hypothetical protein
LNWRKEEKWLSKMKIKGMKDLENKPFYLIKAIKSCKQGKFIEEVTQITPE